MPGRFFLLVILLAATAGGCATVSEERISMLESAVMDLQAQDMRLASLEDTVAALVAQNTTKTPQAFPGTVPLDLETRPDSRLGPRRVYPEPAPAQPVAAAPEPAPVSPAPVPVSPPPAPAAAPPQAKPAPAKIPTSAQAERRYQAALSTLESGRPQAALAQFQDFLVESPGHALAPNAGYWLGECHYSMKQYDAAISAFKDVVAQYPQHEKAAAAMLKAGYSYALLGDAANARFFLETLVKDFPSSQPAALARARLASL